MPPTYQLEWKDTISPIRMPSSNRKKTRRQVIARRLRERLAAGQQPRPLSTYASRRHLPSFSRRSGVPHRLQKLRQSPRDSSK